MQNNGKLANDHKYYTWVHVCMCDKLVTYKGYSRMGRFCNAQSGMHLYTNQVELETRTRAYECKGVSHSTGHIIHDTYPMTYEFCGRFRGTRTGYNIEIILRSILSSSNNTHYTTVCKKILAPLVLQPAPSLVRTTLRHCRHV